MELTPRTLGEDDLDGGAGGSPGRRARRRWLPLLVIAVVLVAIGFIVYKGLADATVYFRNADEAVAERDELGTRRFRLQGTVQDEPTVTAGTVDFTVAYNDVSVDVRHVGDPPQLFRPGIPVVLEGAWSAGDDTFASDRILVKHDETYESQEDYDERVREAEDNGDDTAGGSAAAGEDLGTG